MRRKLGLAVVLAMAGTLLFCGVSMAGYCSDNALPDGCIKFDDLSNRSVRAPALAPGVVNTLKIKDGTIRTEDLADNSVNSAKVLNESLTGADIDDGTITGADIMSNSISSVDLSNEPGLDWVNKSSLSLTSISSSPTAMTNIAIETLTAPSSGYVVVLASGFAALTAADQALHLCIDDASGGSTCDSHDHILENNTDEVTSGNWENRKEFSIHEVYAVASGSNTFYLKAYRESASATGVVYWDDFLVMFFPSFY